MTRRLRNAARAVVVAAVAATVGAMGAGCAARMPPAAPGPPRYPEYVFPAAPPELGDATLTARQQEAWARLQSGDANAAERGFGDLLRRQADFYPAQAGLGYVELAKGDDSAALARFESVLADHAAYAPALAGKGAALLAVDRTEDALAAFQAAIAADPSLSGVERRVDVLRFRVQEALVARARQAGEAGRVDEALDAYERAVAGSPDSPFLYREMAELERVHGRLERALAHARKAVALDPGDARALVTLADVQVARGDYAAAVSALGRAVDLDPSDAVRRRLDEVRDQAAMAKLPDEFRAIPDTPEITRGDLAALIGVRLAPLVAQAPQREGVFITDTRAHWASSWILEVARAGVMEAYPNYTFQPRAVVNRGALAAVVSRLLSLLARAHPALATEWRSAAYPFTDLSPGHLGYPAAALAVTAGVMPVLDGQTFRLARTVSGAEAVAAVRRLQELTGLVPR